MHQQSRLRQSAHLASHVDAVGVFAADLMQPLQQRLDLRLGQSGLACGKAREVAVVRGGGQQHHAIGAQALGQGMDQAGCAVGMPQRHGERSGQPAGFAQGGRCQWDGQVGARGMAVAWQVGHPHGKARRHQHVGHGHQVGRLALPAVHQQGGWPVAPAVKHDRHPPTVGPFGRGFDLDLDRRGVRRPHLGRRSAHGEELVERLLNRQSVFVAGGCGGGHVVCPLAVGAGVHSQA